MPQSVFRRSRYSFVVLTAAGALLLVACGSNSSGGGKNGGTSAPQGAGNTSTTAGQYGTLPAASGTPAQGGTVTYPITSGAQPNYIFPISPGANSSVYNAQWDYLMYRTLYWTPEGNRPVVDDELSLAQEPVYSNGNKTITIKMDPSYKWSDGTPVDAADVEFFIDELRAAVKENSANFGNYTPGAFPDNVVSMSTPDPETLVLNLNRGYNPEWYTDTQLVVIQPLPSTAWNIASAGGKHLDFSDPANAKKIYDYLNGESKKVSTYATNPLWQDVDGPFKLTSFNATTDANSLVANPAYGGTQKPYIHQFNMEYFASSTAEFNAMLAGKLSVGFVPSASIPQVPRLRSAGYNVYGYPDLGFAYIVFNFKDTTNNWDKIIGQLYVRQALAHLEDQQAVITGVYNGAAAQAYGPVPAIPQTNYVPSNASTDPYPFSVSDASSLLTAHGWKVVPNGTTTCQSPGTGANQCGAGIPKGQNLNFTVYYTNDPPVAGQETQALASEAKKIGINITPVSKTFNYIIQNYDDPSAPQNNNKWQVENFGGFNEDIYPTTDEIFNIKGSFNEGGYTDPKADALIKQSKFSSNPQALKNEASYITENLPGIFTPNEDRIWAWKGVTGVPDSFANLTQFGLTPEYWYLTK